MARIRTIKPEFPQSESLGRVSREARLLFVNLFTIADDQGRARANSRMLASLLYPFDDGEDGHPKTTGADIDRWMAELEREGCARRYEVDGNTYVEIPKWLEHQKIDHPSKSKLPAYSDSLAKPRETFAKPSETFALEGNGEEGRGKDLEEARSACADAPPSQGVCEDDDDELDLPAENDRTHEGEAVRAYNDVALKLGWPKCAKVSTTRRAKIRARLRDCGGMDGWYAALAKAQASPFLRGESGRSAGHESWRPSIDFFLQESSFLKLTEGAYGGSAPPEEPPPGVDPVEWYAARHGVKNGPEIEDRKPH